MKEYYFPRANPLLVVREFYAIFCTLNRRNELKRLVDWATHKKLRHPLRLYQTKQADEERRILRYRSQSPRMFRYAILLHFLSRLINPIPKYLPKGSARIYSSRHLTYQPKSHSIVFRSI